MNLFQHTFKLAIGYCSGILVLLLFLGVFHQAHGQQWLGDTNATDNIYRTGNVGIGIAQPRSRLDLGLQVGANNGLRVGSYLVLNERETVNNASFIGFNCLIDPNNVSLFKPDWTGNADASGMIMTMSSGGKSNIDFYGIHWGQDPTARNLNEFQHVLRLSINGNVGIGTANPSDKLQVGYAAKLNLRLGSWATLGLTGGGLATVIGNNIKASTSIDDRMEYISNTTSGGRAIKMSFDEGISFHTWKNTVSAGDAFSGKERMRIDNNGNVGIGTTDPGTYKLAVEGKIGARSIKVTSAAWADYVFAPNYALMPLSEVELFIQTNGHLPEVPAAREIEENGFVLEEMDAVLMSKIEELTLHMINQAKLIERQQAEIKKLQAKVNTLVDQ